MPEINTINLSVNRPKAFYCGVEVEVVETWMDGGKMYARIQFNDGSLLTVYQHQVYLGGY